MYCCGLCFSTESRQVGRWVWCAGDSGEQHSGAYLTIHQEQNRTKGFRLLRLDGIIQAFPQRRQRDAIPLQHRLSRHFPTVRGALYGEQEGLGRSVQRHVRTEPAGEVVEVIPVRPSEVVPDPDGGFDLVYDGDGETRLFAARSRTWSYECCIRNRCAVWWGHLQPTLICTRMLRAAGICGGAASRSRCRSWQSTPFSRRRRGRRRRRFVPVVVHELEPSLTLACAGDV